MNDAPELSGIVISGIDPVPQIKKPTVFQIVKCKVFNLIRRPLVKQKQKELELIFLELHGLLCTQVFVAPSFLFCKSCKDAKLIIQSQAFTSMIRRAIQTMRCEEHFEIYASFLVRYENKFLRSEELARWINGF